MLTQPSLGEEVVWVLVGLGCGLTQAWVVGGEEEEERNNQAMGMMQHLISTMEKVGVMVKIGHQRGNGQGHRKGGGRGKKIYPHRQSCQREGTVMIGIWVVRGKGRGTEEIGTGKETGTGRGTEEIGRGTGMTEIAMVIITDTESVSPIVMKIGIGEGHLGDEAGQGRLITQSGDGCRTSDVAGCWYASVGAEAVRGGIFLHMPTFYRSLVDFYCLCLQGSVVALTEM
jgi:hypothetical protein